MLHAQCTKAMKTNSIWLLAGGRVLLALSGELLVRSRLSGIKGAVLLALCGDDNKFLAMR